MSQRIKIIAMGMIVIVLCMMVTITFAQEKPYAGVTLKLITEAGYNKNAVNFAKPEWEAKTGAKIEVIAVPFGEIYMKTMTSFTLEFLHLICY